MTPSVPTIDDILGHVIHAERERATGVKRRRIDLVESLLRECLETDGERILVEPDRVLLAAERQFEPDGAFTRTMHAEDLLFVLPLFLTSPWLRPNHLEQRVQLDLAEILATAVMRSGLVPREGRQCILMDIRGAIDRGRWELYRAKRERQRMRRAAQETAMAERRAALVESLRPRQR
ncbi:hypothetical protein E3T24_12550 [Cryobacterium sp. TmT2-59]|uniref:Uncharacterized protein n=1 Tax=Cryobacterium shii TaxID=1259235 RepID=A0AAQ2C735_9MICO|nr:MULTISPECIES: hypothetical protein [Cryobacterium]TFC48893.1 hypothetical protein E3O49_06690 [Cryobacterium shii]TFC82950.1 hypothetical protein E3T24_12550 [Cryobacterium sp. TmT2-59]TFD25745.1 hypothetical protein E3T32_03735 [Cryobacterium sp. TMT2-23]